MDDLLPTMTVSPQAGLFLTKIADTPDFETALWKVLHEYVDLKLKQIRQEINVLELKWGMTFPEFSQRCEDGSLEDDPYAYAVEKDFWDWEKFVTLRDHYEALQARWM